MSLPIRQGLPFCRQCERDFGWYGVEMSPYETTEPWRDGFRCPNGHVMASEGYGGAHGLYEALDDRPEPSDYDPADDPDAGWHIPEFKPGSTGGSSSGRTRKKPPKKSDRMRVPVRPAGVCWRCEGPTGSINGRVHYCEGCKQANARDKRAAQRRRWRDRRRNG